MEKFNQCQSCGMPLTEESFYGTEKDGSKNADYCKYCYENGEFKQPNITMEEMIDICVPFMIQKGMNEEEARTLMNQHLPHLKRWKKE